MVSEEILHFFKTLRLDSQHLKKLENWERKFIVERAEELKIEGVKEFLQGSCRLIAPKRKKEKNEETKNKREEKRRI